MGRIHLAPELLETIDWRCIGPHRGGRVVAVAGDPAHAQTFYFGACAGGRLEDQRRQVVATDRQVVDGDHRQVAVERLPGRDRR